MTETLAPKLAEPKRVLSGASMPADHSEGMSYLQTLPRRLITLYLPLAIILIVLLFPFYWMALTAIKPDEQLLDLERFNPFWTWNPTPPCTSIALHAITNDIDRRSQKNRA